MDKYLTKNEYRTRIQNYINNEKKQNGRGAFKKCYEGIGLTFIESKNLLNFLKGDDNRMSTKKLDSILKSLEVYCNNKRMTNEERIINFTHNQRVKELERLFIENPLRDYVDVDAWLKSTSKDIIYKGKRAQLLDPKTRKKIADCVVIEEHEQFGQQYVKIIDLEENIITDVPIERIIYE